MPPAGVRRYRHADRAGALALIGHPGAIDSPGHDVDVAEEGGRIVAAAVGLPDPFGDYRIGSIRLEDSSRMDLFHRLLVAQLRRARQRGFTHVVVSTNSAALIEWVRRTYPPGVRTAEIDAELARGKSWSFRLPIAYILRALPRGV